jgi:hypothetical protein
MPNKPGNNKGKAQVLTDLFQVLLVFCNAKDLSGIHKAEQNKISAH